MELGGLEPPTSWVRFVPSICISYYPNAISSHERPQLEV
jgi:hypothetical protein